MSNTRQDIVWEIEEISRELASLACQREYWRNLSRKGHSAEQLALRIEESQRYQDRMELLVSRPFAYYQLAQDMHIAIVMLTGGNENI